MARRSLDSSGAVRLCGPESLAERAVLRDVRARFRAGSGVWMRAGRGDASGGAVAVVLELCAFSAGLVRVPDRSGCLAAESDPGF